MHASDLLDEFMLSLCVWREARGEGYFGMKAVASVIRNRVADPRWPHNLRDVVLQKRQFSCFNADDPQVTKYPDFNDVWDECVRACEFSLRGDPTNGANHYHSTSIAPPKWADPAKITARIGNHIFYKL